jgi:hypothetical protein
MNEQAQWIIGWWTLSVINAGLAQSKGRSGWVWWYSSLFFGPLATLLIVVLPAAGHIWGLRTYRPKHLDADARETVGNGGPASEQER